jgi:hypothetical protein
LRVKFPFMNRFAVIGYHGVAAADPRLRIEVAQFALIGFIAGIHLLHKVQYIRLIMTVCGQSGSYGNDLAQNLSRISVKKKAVVQSVDKIFMTRLFLKLASASFCHTFRIQYKKNNTTGSMINKNK